MSYELNMTKDNSYAQVAFTGNSFIVTFPYNRVLYAKVHNISGALYDEEEQKFIIPRGSVKELTRELGTQAIWKSKEEMQHTAKSLSAIEETLEDVLDRIPKNLETPYMNINPYNFQKVAIGWAITKKGKNGQIYGGLLGDEMGGCLNSPCKTS